MSTTYKTINKAFKYRLYPNQEQELQLLRFVENMRIVWNKFVWINKKYNYHSKKEKEQQILDIVDKCLVSIEGSYEFTSLRTSIEDCYTNINQLQDLAKQDKFTDFVNGIFTEIEDLLVKQEDIAIATTIVLKSMRELRKYIAQDRVIDYINGYKDKVVDYYKQNNNSGREGLLEIIDECYKQANQLEMQDRLKDVLGEKFAKIKSANTNSHILKEFRRRGRLNQELNSGIKGKYVFKNHLQIWVNKKFNEKDEKHQQFRETYPFIKETLKQEYEYLAEAPAISYIQVARNFNNALNECFKQGRGFPRYKNNASTGSFYYYSDYGQEVDADGNTYKKNVYYNKFGIQVPKLPGYIKWRQHRAIEGRPLNATISKEGGHWYVSVCCEVQIKHIEREYDESSFVGCDLGLNYYATLSDNNARQYKGPKHHDKYEKKLLREQRKLSRKKRGSNNSRKQALRLANVHRKVVQARHDFLHKLSYELVHKYYGLSIEDLSIKDGMMNKELRSSRERISGKKNYAKNKNISNAAWGKFRSLLEYKSGWYGSQLVVVDPRNTSKTCNNCGNIKENLELSERTYKCTKCGIEIDRDYNASLNIQKLGLKKLRKSENKN